MRRIASVSSTAVECCCGRARRVARRRLQTWNRRWSAIPTGGGTDGTERAMPYRGMSFGLASHGRIGVPAASLHAVALARYYENGWEAGNDDHQRRTSSPCLGPSRCRRRSSVVQRETAKQFTTVEHAPIGNCKNAR
ncbi:protein of unknown function (plasmid) [Pararobbsia alpina]